MGRHSVPDDTDEDVDLDEGAVDGASGVAVATEPPGRHTGNDGGRPRPGPEPGLDLIADAFEPEHGDVEPEHGDNPERAGVPGPVAEPLPGPMVIIDAETSEAVVLEPITETDGSTDGSTDRSVDEAPTTEIPLAEIARHDRPLPEETTARIAPVPAEPSDPPEHADAPRPHPEPTPRDSSTPSRGGGAHATRHDFALVMAHGDVRARVAAAVLVPFVVYVAVLAVIGELTVHNLIWIWAPAVAAGVLVGLVLDAGHRRYPGPAVGRPGPVNEPADPA
jgi:hypothetical protein